MENAMMVALSRQMTLRRELSIVANNLANMNTAGFKVEQMLVRTDASTQAQHQDGPSNVDFVQDWGVARDFSTGQIENTGRPLDVALVGRGFFAVQTPQGERYTRDGRFTVDATGTLSTSDGMPVLDDSGAPIVLDTNSSAPAIDQNGNVSVNGQQVAKLKVVGFKDLGVLSKDGSGRYSAPASANPEQLDAPKILQAHLERSNVVPILEMNRMIEVTRSYQSVTNMLASEEDLTKNAIQRLGRVA